MINNSETEIIKVDHRRKTLFQRIIYEIYLLKFSCQSVEAVKCIEGKNVCHKYTLVMGI